MHIEMDFSLTIYCVAFSLQLLLESGLRQRSEDLCA